MQKFNEYLIKLVQTNPFELKNISHSKISRKVDKGKLQTIERVGAFMS